MQPPVRMGEGAGSARRPDAEDWVKEGLRHLLEGNIDAAARCQALAEEIDGRDWNALQLGLMVTRLRSDEPGVRRLLSRLVAADRALMPLDPGRASAMLQFFDLSDCVDVLEAHFDTDPAPADGEESNRIAADGSDRRLFVVPGQPRSASRSIVEAVRRRFGLSPLPTVDVPLVGRRPFSSWTLLARRLARLAPLGGLPHTHAAASAANLRTLRSIGVHHICVTIRDPRQGFYSYLNGWLEHVRRDRAVGLYFMGSFLTPEMISAGPERLAEACIRARYPDYLRWLDGWVALSEETRRIRLVRFRDVVEDPTAQLDAIGRHLGLEAASGSAVAELPAATRRRGQTDEFRHALPRPLTALMQELTPQRLLDRCGWPR